jgi:hypothetical protein
VSVCVCPQRFVTAVWRLTLAFTIVLFQPFTRLVLLYLRHAQIHNTYLGRGFFSLSPQKEHGTCETIRGVGNFRATQRQPEFFLLHYDDGVIATSGALTLAQFFVEQMPRHMC